MILKIRKRMSHTVAIDLISLSLFINFVNGNLSYNAE